MPSVSPLHRSHRTIILVARANSHVIETAVVSYSSDSDFNGALWHLHTLVYILVALIHCTLSDCGGLGVATNRANTASTCPLLVTVL